MKRLTLAAPILALTASHVVAQDLRLLDVPLFGTIEHDVARGRTLAMTWTGETLELDGANWRQLPVARKRGAAGRFVYDTRRDRMLHVGDDYTELLLSTFDGTGWNTVPTGVTPSRRHSFTAAFDSLRDELVLFGGQDSITHGELGDTWVFDGQQWQQRLPVVQPAPSSGAASSYDLVRGVTVLYRGDLVAETWEWNGAAWTLTVSGAAPGPRRAGAMTYDLLRQQTLLYGGSSATVFDDLWAWDGIAWTQIAVAQPIPPTRAYPHMAFDRVLGEAVLVDTGEKPDTWSWNGSRWLQRNDGRKPMNQGDTVAFAAPTGTLHAFVASLPQTWRWDGRDWQPVPGSQPTPRVLASTATGPTHAYLLGGLNPSTSWNALTDLWGFDGSQWALLSNGAPANRIGQAIAFDWTRNELVCFGGATPDYMTTNAETWVFDGVAWHLRTPAQSPAARVDAVMTYDPTRGAVVLHGGSHVSQGPLSDTWQWDGATWIPIASALAPVAWQGPSLAFDAVRNASVLLQSRAGGRHVDAWQLTPQGWMTLSLGDTDLWFGLGGRKQAIGFPQLEGLLLVDTRSLFHLDTRQATITERGTPCTPSAPTLAAARWSRPGASDFALDVLRAPSASFVALVVGLQPANLPLGSCTLLVQNGSSLLVPTSVHGTARVPMPIPGSPAFLGLSCHAQAAALDAAAPAGFTLSAALDVTIGT